MPFIYLLNKLPTFVIYDKKWNYQIYNSEGRGSDILQIAMVPIIPNSVCNSHSDYKRFGKKLSASQLCAGNLSNGGMDACQGDSGGPLVCDDILIGVVSFGYRCGEPNFPGIYSRVGYFIDWINSNMGDSSLILLSSNKIECYLSILK